MIAKVIIILSFFVAVSLQSGSPFKPCESGARAPLYFNVTGCGPTDSECVFHVGKSIVAWFTWISPYVSDSLTAKVTVLDHQWSDFGWLPYPWPQKNGCLTARGIYNCPTQVDAVTSYATDRISIPTIPFLTPTGRLVYIKWSMVDHLKRESVCLIATARIMPAQETSHS